MGLRLSAVLVNAIDKRRLFGPWLGRPRYSLFRYQSDHRRCGIDVRSRPDADADADAGFGSGLFASPEAYGFKGKKARSAPQADRRNSPISHFLNLAAALQLTHWLDH